MSHFLLYKGVCVCARARSSITLKVQCRNEICYQNTDDLLRLQSLHRHPVDFHQLVSGVQQPCSENKAERGRGGLGSGIMSGRWDGDMYTVGRGGSSCTPGLRESLSILVIPARTPPWVTSCRLLISSHLPIQAVYNLLMIQLRSSRNLLI